MFLSPSHIDPSLDSRSVTFENPTVLSAVPMVRPATVRVAPELDDPS